jgi:hypothetical protein
MMNRAAKGGQIGCNGEGYKGGRFLPANPNRAKVEGSTPRKPRKVEIEPRVWAEVPVGFTSFYDQLRAVIVDYDAAAKQIAIFDASHQFWKRADRAWFVARVNAFNAGERVTIVG